MKQIMLLTSLLFAVFCGVQAQETYYEKHLIFPEKATAAQKLDMASRLIPTPQQLEWQQMEFTAFLHFGINTFTGREWGDGTEAPALFNPTELDCEQWVRALKDGGFKMAIITAKHHDGFCLWPTKTTRHSVASSPWRGGKGDLVRELRNACDKYGIKFGIYLSPWDRNAACYGDSPVYNQFFIEQLTELLTQYGEIHEVWFDGANGEGPNGKKQEYDWDAVIKTIRRLQPKAVTAIMGDDVRWVGNEKGIGRETEWSATALPPGIYSRSEELRKGLGIYGKAKDLGGRDIVARAIDNEMKQRGEDHVYLDVTHKDPEETKKHFPNIYKKCLSIGIDITKEYIPVAPAAHYLCGGIKVDLDGQSSIRRLYAIGECSCTGLHGGNRLASNSLIEAVVYADAAAKHALSVLERYDFNEDIPEWNDEGTISTEERVLITQSMKEVNQIMEAYVGIVRSNTRLTRAWNRLDILYEETEALFKRSKATRELCELRNMINVGYLITKQAMERKESRGLHYTIDYPHVGK